MLLHLPSVDHLAAAVPAFKLSFDTIIGDVLVHGVEHETNAAVEQASDFSKDALVVLVRFHVFAQDQAAFAGVVGALEQCVLANIEVSLHVAALRLRFAFLVRALSLKLEHEPSDRDIGLQLTDDPHVAQWACSCVLDALFAEQVVATGCFDGVVEDIKTDRTDPAIVCQALRREVRETLRAIKFLHAGVTTLA